MDQVYRNIFPSQDFSCTAQFSFCLIRNDLFLIHKPPASIRFAPIKHALAVTVEPFKFSTAYKPVAYEWSYSIPGNDPVTVSGFAPVPFTAPIANLNALQII
jgi:hypothetical protein